MDLSPGLVTLIAVAALVIAVLAIVGVGSN